MQPSKVGKIQNKLAIYYLTVTQYYESKNDKCYKVSSKTLALCFICLVNVTARVNWRNKVTNALNMWQISEVFTYNANYTGRANKK